MYTPLYSSAASDVYKRQVEDYSASNQMPNLNSIFTGGISGAVKRFGQFIDGGALAFIAKEAGCIVTTLDGSDLPPPNSCSDYKLPGLIIATSKSIHQDLLNAVRDNYLNRP